MGFLKILRGRQPVRDISVRGNSRVRKDGSAAGWVGWDTGVSDGWLGFGGWMGRRGCKWVGR